MYCLLKSNYEDGHHFSFSIFTGSKRSGSPSESSEHSVLSEQGRSFDMAVQSYNSVVTVSVFIRVTSKSTSLRFYLRMLSYEFSDNVNQFFKYFGTRRMDGHVLLRVMVKTFFLKTGSKQLDFCYSAINFFFKFEGLLLLMMMMT